MADRAINELIEATQMLPADLFVLQQDGQAKKLSGQTFTNFLTKLADGHGGIVSIIKTRTSGLVDTYTITLADRSTSTFTITNGKKGDTGAQTYVWIKYASVNPESYPHSFGDLPAPWLGIYTGLKSSAPTLWSDYKWFEIKGDKGDTGAPARLQSWKTEYQVSDSGTVQPSSTWLSAPPQVPKGHYLWTRTTQIYNTGSPVVSYGVSYVGLDGAGSVSSVNNLGPDPSGNVNISASDIGAATSADISQKINEIKSVIKRDIDILPSAWNTYTSNGPEEIGLKNMGYTYRASMPVSGVVYSMIPYLTLDLATVEEAGVNVANMMRCYDGGVLLYADGKPSQYIKVLTAEFRRSEI